MNRLLALFNKLGKRERMGALFIAALVIYFMFDLTLVGPAEKRHKALKSELAKVEADLNALRNDMTVVKAELEKDPFAKDRAQLDQYKRAVEDAAAFIATVDTDPRQIAALLRQLIAGTPGVTLVSLKTLPPLAISESRAGAPVQRPQQQAPAAALYRRGIELTIRGNYLAMLPYLEKIQNLPQKVLWAEAEFGVTAYPDATLKLTLYTLSVQSDSRIG